MITVVLADDHALLRAGLRALLDDEEDITVVGEAADGDEAVALARTLHPNVVLMDISMPRVDGIEAARRMSSDPELAGVRVLLLTTFETDENVFAGLRSGASGFLLKGTEPNELARAVRIVASGDALLSPSVTRMLLTELAMRPELARTSTPERLRWLTRREREVMALVAMGLTNDEIAERLVVSPATAKTHVSRVMRKLNAHDRAQVVVLAYESGLVRPGTLVDRGA